MTVVDDRARATDFVARRAPLGRLLRAELRWVFRRPRTLVALALLTLFPLGVGISSLVIDAPVNAAGQSLLSSIAGNELALPIISLSGLLVVLLPLVCAMSAADALAGESANGTLRGLLLAPVGRLRLLAMKAFGVGAVGLLAAVLVAAVGFVTGLAISGGAGAVTLSGTTLSLGDTVAKVAVATLWTVVQLWAVSAIALAISACTDHPLVVMATTLGGLIVFSLLGQIPALDWLQPFLITSGWNSIIDVLRDPTPSDGLVTGALRAACYLLIGYSLAAARMLTRDG